MGHPPYKSLKQGLHDKMGLGNYNQQCHMGPAKLKINEKHHQPLTIDGQYRNCHNEFALFQQNECKKTSVNCFYTYIGRSFRHSSEKKHTMMYKWVESLT